MAPTETVCVADDRARDSPAAAILVADDSPDIVRFLSCCLRAGGYRVMTAFDGAEALKLAASCRPDAVLLDVMMPGMDGLETCRRLKSDPDLRTIPVILITARREEDDVIDGLDAGADDYVTKPVNPRLLGARVRSALRVKKSQDALAEVNRDLQAELARRQRAETELVQAQKLEAMGRLAAGIAHEINTPAQYIGDNLRFLAGAFGDLEGLLAAVESLQPKASENGGSAAALAQIETQAQAADLPYLRQEVPVALKQSLEGIEQIASIVRAMKEFAHPGSDEKQPTDINRAIENTLTVTRNRWKYVADVVADLDPALPPVPCVVGAINQAILNLLVNAADAIAEAAGGSGSKGTITVRTRRDGDWAEIEVADTGTGIPDEIRARVFEPFFTTKDVGKGTGQGLAITRATVVEKHGGTIRFETAAGRGTTFIVRLPISGRPGGGATLSSIGKIG